MQFDIKKIFRRKKYSRNKGYSRFDPRRLTAKRSASEGVFRRRIKSLLNRLLRLPARFRLQRKAQRQRIERDQIYRFTARHYPGSRHRRYMIHVPPGYSARGKAPLVMVLHGCHQTHLDIRQVSGFDAIADREGFIVVYPYITSYRGLRSKNCWGWWFKNEITPGQGEVEDLWQIVEEVKELYHIDPRRIHVTGLSSGGGMAVAMMVAHVDRIASGAVVAGVAYSETARAVGFARVIKGVFKPVGRVVRAMRAAMGPRLRSLPIMVIHSHDDATVNIQAAFNIRDSWASCFRINLREADTSSGATGKTRWKHSRYHGGHRQTMIETLFLSGPGHGWYGGAPGNYSYPQAPDISEMMWSFFERHVNERSVSELSTGKQSPASVASTQVRSA